MDRVRLNRLSKAILDSALEVHKNMCPGLLESVYEECLIQEFKIRNINYSNQVVVPLLYKNKKLNKEFKLDILVEDEIILELKTVEKILPVHEVQIISYLKLANKKLGFLINFNDALMKYGFKRFVNNF